MRIERERGRCREREWERGIIIQLSVLCRAELTRTEADFLLLTHPSATSPCRKREEEEGKEGEAGWIERKGNTHTHAQQIIQNFTYTAQTSTCCSYSTIGATIRHVVIIIIEWTQLKWKICHDLFTFMLFKTCMTDCPQWSTKETFWIM